MERIAKFIARSGVSSRREVEKLIFQKLVTLNGKVVETPATFVSEDDKIEVCGKVVSKKEQTRIFRYYKPKGLVTTHIDDLGRSTVFDSIKKDYPAAPRLISIGRLDLNSEGLLLLTNDGEFSRKAELSKDQSFAWKRSYRVRIFGDFNLKIIDIVKKGITIDGVNYAPIRIEQEESDKWLQITLIEGKNRTIRKIMEHFGIVVSRLIRFEYGPYKLNYLKPSQLKEDIVRV